MTIQKIDESQVTNLSNQAYKSAEDYTDFWSVKERDTDGNSGSFETTFSPNWKKWHGYYRQVSIFASAVDKLASFTVGRGFEIKKRSPAPGIINALVAGAKSLMTKLNLIKGWGKDDFNSILENQLRTCLICGDSFAEIIRDRQGRLINLKPLNPGAMKIIVDKKNMLKGYEEGEQKFKPDEIFHLSWNRIANEMHGIPMAERMEHIMKMIKGVQNVQEVMFQRYIKPLIIIGVDTDDTTEISTFKTKMESAYKKSEMMIVPSETVNEIKTVSIPQFSVHDPMPWLRFLTDIFAEDIGVAKFTGEKITEASAKIIYLAFQQTIERLQRFIEAQLRMQLRVEINLEFPASIAPELLADLAKDGKMNKPLNLDPTKEE